MVALAGSSVGTEDVPVGPSLSVKKVCGAGCKTLSVDADGSVYPCHMLHVGQYRMGNAITGTVEEALQSDVAALSPRSMLRTSTDVWDAAISPCAAEAAGPGRSSSPATCVRKIPTAR